MSEGRSLRIGQGFDAHRLVDGRALVLGGVPIAHPRGLAGHSDGDVLLHAVGSALLGALGRGDLGRHFPSSDASLSGIASHEIVRRIVERVAEAGLEVGNLDATLIAQEPRLAASLAAMEACIAALLGVALAAVNVQVTSTDGLGAVGRGEGIAAQAVVLLRSRSAPPEE